jgi:hypothetical protein
MNEYVALFFINSLFNPGAKVKKVNDNISFCILFYWNVFVNISLNVFWQIQSFSAGTNDANVVILENMIGYSLLRSKIKMINYLVNGNIEGFSSDLAALLTNTFHY